MKHKTRILFVVKSNDFSGAEIVLCNYLKNNNDIYDYFVLTNEELRKCFEKELPNEKVIFSSIMQDVSVRTPIKWCYLMYKNIRLIKTIIKKNRIDILYGNNSSDIFLLALQNLFSLRKIPMICHVHDMLVLRNPFRNRKALALKLLNKVFAAIIVPSEATKRCICQLIDSCNVYIVYNGIDCLSNIRENILKRSMSWEKSIVKIGFIGTFDQRKRPDLFIDVIKVLYKELRINCDCIMIGKIVDKPLYKCISGFIRDDELPVKIIGEIDRPEIQQNLLDIDILLLLSDRDPLPTIIIEAMASGVIVIARNVDGVPEIITNNTDGFIFNYDASAKEIAEIIYQVTIVKKESILGVMNNAHKKVREKFSHENKEKGIRKIIEFVKMKDKL